MLYQRTKLNTASRNVVYAICCTLVLTALFYAFFNQECMFGICKVVISVFLFLIVWLKPEVIRPFCELQHVRFDSAQMHTQPQQNCLLVLLLVQVYRDIVLNGFLVFFFVGMNEKTLAIDYNRRMFFLLAKLCEEYIRFTFFVRTTSVRQ